MRSKYGMRWRYRWLFAVLVGIIAAAAVVEEVFAKDVIILLRGPDGALGVDLECQINVRSTNGSFKTYGRYLADKDGKVVVHTDDDTGAIRWTVCPSSNFVFFGTGTIDLKSSSGTDRGQFDAPLKPCIPVVGRVIDEKGKGVAGIKVQMLGATSDVETGSGTLVTFADQDGRFSFPQNTSTNRVEVSVVGRTLVNEADTVCGANPRRFEVEVCPMIQPDRLQGEVVVRGKWASMRQVEFSLVWNQGVDVQDVVSNFNGEARFLGKYNPTMGNMEPFRVVFIEGRSRSNLIPEGRYKIEVKQLAGASVIDPEFLVDDSTKSIKFHVIPSAPAFPAYPVVVLDAASGEPVSAVVTVHEAGGSNSVLRTDQKGVALIRGKAGSSCLIDVSARGYKKLQSQKVVFGQTQRIPVVPLKGLFVTVKWVSGMHVTNRLHVAAITKDGYECEAVKTNGLYKLSVGQEEYVRLVIVGTGVPEWSRLVKLATSGDDPNHVDVVLEASVRLNLRPDPNLTAKLGTVGKNSRYGMFDAASLSPVPVDTSGSCEAYKGQYRICWATKDEIIELCVTNVQSAGDIALPDRDVGKCKRTSIKAFMAEVGKAWWGAEQHKTALQAEPWQAGHQ